MYQLKTYPKSLKSTKRPNLSVYVGFLCHNTSVWKLYISMEIEWSRVAKNICLFA